jgi:hypothetical protein
MNGTASPETVPARRPAAPSRGRKILIALLTVAVFAAMIYWARPGRVVQLFSGLGWRGTLWLFLIYQTTQAFRALRLWGALPGASRPGRITLWGIVSIHQLLNHIMPLRLGELSLPLLLKRFSPVNSSAAVAALVIVRLQEIFVLALIFLVAAAQLGRMTTSGHRIEWLTMGVLSIFGLLVLRAALPAIIRGLGRLMHRFEQHLPRRGDALRRIDRFLQELSRHLSIHFPWHKQIWFFLLTLGIWLNTFFLFHEMLRMSGLHLRFTQTIVGSAFANLTQALPINTIGSFGSMEAGWTLGFSLLGIDAGTALATGLAMHVLIVGFLAVSAMVSWGALNTHARRSA